MTKVENFGCLHGKSSHFAYALNNTPLYSFCNILTSSLLFKNANDNFCDVGTSSLGSNDAGLFMRIIFIYCFDGNMQLIKTFVSKASYNTLHEMQKNN